MFLIERFFGIVCYLVALAFVFVTIYYKKIRIKDALTFYLIVLSLFAYFYEPYETADLFRIREIMNAFSTYNFKNFIDLHFNDSSTPAAYLLYWLIGRTGNLNILPAITTLITYSATFYIIYKSSKLYSLSNPKVAIILLFVMSTGNYMMVISNIRTMLAVSLICFCFFRESVLKKFRWWHILLYVIAALTHNLSVILIIIRCVAFVVDSSLKLKWKILTFAFFVGMGGSFLVRFNWLFDSVFNKAINYITGDKYSYLWEYVISFFAIIIEIIAINMQKKANDFKLKENKTYLLLCVIIACIFVSEFTIFHRMITYISPILAIPILASGFSNSYIRGKQRQVFYLSMLMLFIACFRGSLSSLKFFVL